MKILAPLRGVTIRCFRETFAKEIAEAGFTEAITPFIAALPGLDPTKDRELRGKERVTPQLIGKDPVALREALMRLKDVGYETCDLNAGCPFPMVRNKGRGSGLLKTPRVLAEMMAVGCEVMGEGRFSVKTRLGVDRPDELLGLMPLVNQFPLRFLTVHARTARQMYTGAVDRAAFDRVAAVCRVPLVYNGDVGGTGGAEAAAPCGALAGVMIGRGFVRSLGAREDAEELVLRYLEASRAELGGERPVLGRLKELLSYWKDLPGWSRRWQVVKLARSLDEFRLAVR